MPPLLGNKALSEEVQEQNNSKNNYFIVFGVLFYIFVFSYLFTQIYRWISLPSPLDFFNSLGIIKNIILFDDDTNLDSLLYFNSSNNINFDSDNERLIFFGILAITFLATYFLKVKYKRFSIVTGTLAIFFIIFSWQTPLLFLTMHLFIYISLHNKNKYASLVSGFSGCCFFYIVFPFETVGIIEIIISIIWGICFYAIYKYGFIKLLEIPTFTKIFRTILIQITMISVIISLIINSISGYIWSFPIGLFIFFLQWQRLILYYIDYKDKLVPVDLSLVNYLSVFVNPSSAVNLNLGNVIGSGYRYLNNNFLVDDKNKIILDGLKIWNIALFYLIIWNWVPKTLESFIETWFNIPVFISLEPMLKYYLDGNYLSTPTVLISSFMHQIRWFILFGGIVHFKVGVWRILGFKLAPYFDRPWLATNLISLWGRYSFYYREFLVKTFYYPVFLNYFKKNKNLRIFMATFAASCFGNYTWGHFPDVMLTKGLETANLVYILPRWPYYFLLGLGISLTELYLLRKRSNRKPWTKDWKIMLDILMSYLTLQFFSLIHVFARPTPEGTVWEYTKIFLIGLGIHL